MGEKLEKQTGNVVIPWLAQLLILVSIFRGPCLLVHAASLYASKFKNLACGADFSITINNLTYVPDNFGSGNTSKFTGPVPLGTPFVRYFTPLPDNRNLNCYCVELAPGKTLIRASFQYANYDLLQSPPAFKVLVQTTEVVTVDLAKQDYWVEEIISGGTGNTTFCLLAIPGRGAPVISLLEVRPLPPDSYRIEDSSVLLRGRYRINCGSQGVLRFPDDAFDRIWGTDQDWKPGGPNTTSSISYDGSIDLTGVASESLPLLVLQTARKLLTMQYLTYSLKLSSENRTYYVIGYFANLENGTTPVFNITANDVLLEAGYTITTSFVAAEHAFTVAASDWLNYTLMRELGKGFPLLNALEVFELISLVPATRDALAMQNLRNSYTTRIGDWDDWDPCLPVPWQRVNCSSDSGPRVTQLFLSGYLPAPRPGQSLYSLGDFPALTILELQNNMLSFDLGYLSNASSLQVLNLSYNLFSSIPDFSHAKALQILDLHNNHLTGGIPDTVFRLQFLRILDVSNNNLSGPIPEWMSSLPNLIFDHSGNPCLGVESCFVSSPSPVPSKRNNRVIIGASVGGGIFVLLLAACLILLFRRRKHKAPADEVVGQTNVRDWTTSKRFSLKELAAATKNFKNVIGEGGFGSVYYGKLPGGQEVAVKLRADSSEFGGLSFSNEVDMLLRVHHQNLVTLLGFCDEGGKQCLVYEFMPDGTLADNLYGVLTSKSVLDLRKRLRIAIGAAKAIEYLHTNCEPRIIHRDVKSSNILLDANMEAKVSDFGLSKVMTDSDATHVTTLVKGSAGYLDPEYFLTRQLTEKSDVYSFGVVLLEVLCAREPLAPSLPFDEYSLVAWALPHLQAKSFSRVLDPNLEGRENSLSVEIVANVAIGSLRKDPAARPNMTQVVKELEAALSIETSGSNSPSHLHSADARVYAR